MCRSPDIVVREMLRVAKRAVFISDSNLFGQGRRPLRILKFLLYRAGLWNLVKLVQTGGKGYAITAGDGLAYSYSAYFQYCSLAQWADRVIVVPLVSDGGFASSPLPPFDSRCVLLCAVRDGQPSEISAAVDAMDARRIELIEAENVKAAGLDERTKGIRVDVAMRGARMHYAVPSLLARAGLLGTFYTDAYAGNKPLLRDVLKRVDGLLPALSLRGYLGREAEDIEPDQVVSFDLLGIKSTLARQRLRSRSNILSLHASYNARFCRRVASLGFSSAGAVYALNGAALEIFREAKKRGLLCILEQTIAPARIEDRLMAEEAQRWPGCQPGIADLASNPLAEREEAEWRLADCLVCGSEFVATGLESLGVERAKCRIVPYGVDTAAFRPRENRGKADWSQRIIRRHRRTEKRRSLPTRRHTWA